MPLTLSGSGGVTFPNGSQQAAAGRVLQVAQATKSDTWSTTGWGMVDITGLSVTLTPASSASKFLIMSRVYASSSYWSTFVNLVRNGTALHLPDSPGARPSVTSFHATEGTASNSHGFMHMHVITLLDSPNTTSPVTYKLQGSGRSAEAVSTMYVNRSVPDRTGTGAEYDARMASSLVVMEIAQ